MYVSQLYQDTLYRSGDNSGVIYWAQLLDSGTISRAAVAYQFLSSQEFDQNVGSIARLYFGSFDRLPDADGLKYWIGQHQSGVTTQQISNSFINSGEFSSKNSSLDTSSFVSTLYKNVLDRAPDVDGLNFWVKQIQSGLSKADTLLQFTGSQEFKNATDPQIHVLLNIIGLLGSSPDTTTFDKWMSHINNGESEVNVIAQILQSSDYIDRFTG